MSRHSWAWFYFAFDGRISRRQWWLRWALPFSIPMSFLVYVAREMPRDQAGRIGGGWAGGGLGCLLAVLVLLTAFLFTWSSVAVSVKRFHDCDKSGWWLLIGFIPIIGGIWVLYENSYLRGSVGPNRFGPAPA